VPLKPKPPARKGLDLLLEEPLEVGLALRTLDDLVFVDPLSCLVVDVLRPELGLVRVTQVTVTGSLKRVYVEVWILPLLLSFEFCLYL